MKTVGVRVASRCSRSLNNVRKTLAKAWLRKEVAQPRGSETSHVRHDDIHGALALHPVIATLLFRGTGKDRALERQLERRARPLQQHQQPLTGFDDLVLLHHSIAHSSSRRLCFTQTSW